MNDFKRLFGLPAMVGAIDGIHFHIRKPAVSHEGYFYFKTNGYSIACCECFLSTLFEKDEQKSNTTGSRICCYKIKKLAFQAIGLLILFVRNWQYLKTEILTFFYHLPSHPQIVIIGSIYIHNH
jgi:hypothetical protein